jgi:hypothetical protein
MMAFTRKELYDLVWSKPIKTIAADFGLEPVHFANVCDEYDIPRPSAGYWQKLQFGKPVEQPDLDTKLSELIEPVHVRRTAHARALPILKS